MIAAALVIVTLVALLGAVSFGYVLGYRAIFNSNSHATDAQIDNFSAPYPDPYSFTFVYQGNHSSAYFPMIFLPPAASSQVYVRYDCPQCAGPGNFQVPSIEGLDLTSTPPLVFEITPNGFSENTSNLAFVSDRVLENSTISETLVYNLAGSSNDTGYYSIIFPYSCAINPLLDVGSHAKVLDIRLIQNWLMKINASIQTCTSSGLDATILGFTNTYYNRISLNYNRT